MLDLIVVEGAVPLPYLSVDELAGVLQSSEDPHSEPAALLLSFDNEMSPVEFVVQVELEGGRRDADSRAASAEIHTTSILPSV